MIIFDLRFLGVYIPFIFFYKAKEDLQPEIISRTLKRSLSRFYPLAGRVQGVSINCNDQGALFTEACTDLLLHDFLRNTNTDSVKRLYPVIAHGVEWPLLNVKFTYFGSRSESDLGISRTVASFRKAKEMTNKMIQESVQGNTLGQYLMSVLESFPLGLESDLYTMTSWCRKPFYEVDFGWGCPVWIASTPRNENRVLLIDSKDGESVEAWIALPEQDMSVFLCDQELLAYAVLNPPVLI